MSIHIIGSEWELESAPKENWMIDNDEELFKVYSCKNCGSLYGSKAPYCPMCGAPMSNYDKSLALDYINGIPFKEWREIREKGIYIRDNTSNL